MFKCSNILWVQERIVVEHRYKIMNWRKCKYVRIMKLQRNINGQTIWKANIGQRKNSKVKKTNLHIHKPTSVSFHCSLPVFDALSFHNTFEANESLCAFQNMYLEINKKTQQMSKIWGIITDTVKYKDNILKQGPIKFTDTV